jgi:hypothetical protein
MRIKEIYDFRRPKIPYFSIVHPGEEMSLKIKVFCTREEMAEIIKTVVEFGTSKKEN